MTESKMKKVTPEEGQSADIIAENIERLRELFPEAFTEDGVNFDTLRQLLGDVKALDEGEEKYGLSWHGKKKARQMALTPSTGTLLPYPEESVDWENTKNIFIEGDNLEVLKVLQKSFANKVNLIYIDPPYNTDRDFIYPDRFSEGLETYLNYTGQKTGKEWNVSESGREVVGRKHSAWLSMMYPRMILARRILSNDGVICIHIDEHEIANLIELMSEIFGEENCLGIICWDKRNPKGDSTKVAVQHEYLVVFSKNIEGYKDNRRLKRRKKNAEKMIKKAGQLFKKIGSTTIPDEILSTVNKYNLKVDVSAFEKKYELSDCIKDYQTWLSKQEVSGGEAAYKYIDENGDVFRTVSMAWPNKKRAPEEYFIPLKHPRTKRDCPVPERGWRNPPNTMKELLSKGEIIFGDDETKQPERKYLLKDNLFENVPSVLQFGGSDDKLLKGLGIPFENPKPVEFVKQIISFFSRDDGIVVDFFAGSASVGHACLELNQEQDSTRRFILIQLPERISKDNSSQKIAYKFCLETGLDANIAEIGKERLRRCRKMYDEQLDNGFKVFKLSYSNIKVWNPDVSDIEKTLLDTQENLVVGRTDEDILYELLLKRGVDPASEIQIKEVNGKKVFSVGFGVLFACLSDEIRCEDVEAISKLILDWRQELSPASDTHVFFRDSAFFDDVSKTNMVAILNQGDIPYVRSI